MNQADWKALRGAVVGCLSLLRRKSHAGVVTDDKVKAVAQSYLQNLQVQSLGQHDRKLCFQLMECLLDRYPAAARDLEPNHEDPLNLDAAAVLRDNPKMFESNVRRAMASGYV